MFPGLMPQQKVPTNAACARQMIVRVLVKESVENVPLTLKSADSLH